MKRFFYPSLLMMAISPLAAQISPSNNKISVDISTYPEATSFDYDSCFALGESIGMSSVGIFQNWTAIETAPHTFNWMIMDIANFYYPLKNMAIDLTITPIHTNNLEVPADLVGTSFDSPTMINRFNTLLDSVKAHIPNVTLSSLVIGSEHDVYMGNNSTRWAEYTTFYTAVANHARSIWPGLKVATELTFNGITSQASLAQTLNSASDYIGVSYYPLNTDFTVKPISTIPTDFATLVNLYPNKPLCFYQYGYPSSSTCNSSEALQAQFITQTFTTWDTYAAQVRLIDFTWLHDLDAAQVSFYGSYYGLNDPIFLEYLRSIGLRTWNNAGHDKAAFAELLCQAKQRGYNNSPRTCISGTSTPIESFELSISPNPAQNTITLHTNSNLEGAILRIYNPLGQLQQTYTNISTTNPSIDISQLANGLYYCVLQVNQVMVNGKWLMIND